MEYKYGTYSEYGPLALRAVLGLMFLLSGIGKLIGHEGTAGFFASIGIPAAGAMAWLVAVVEVVGGIMLIAGWLLKWSVWPLVVIMIVAIATAVAPGLKSAFQASGLFFHLLAIAALVSLFLTGPGKWGVDKA